jgi:predicted Zn-dependent peptidase
VFFTCSATEAHDDDGLPHTLEHLVFLGSENYPFKVGYNWFIAYTVVLVVVDCKLLLSMSWAKFLF